MISIKSKHEIDRMKKAGYIVALVHKRFSEIIKPGITTKELDTIASRIIEENGAKPSFLDYYGFPATICASVNDVLVHGIPDDTALKDGDIISLDVGAEYEGYHGDSAWTYAIGSISKDLLELMDATKKSLFIALKAIKPGVRIGDVSESISSYIYAKGYSIPRDYTGHGIGANLHEEPVFHNIGSPGHGPVLKTGMTIAIEPMVHLGSARTRLLKDGWTVLVDDGTCAAHYEHTIVVTENGCQILTSLDQEVLNNG